MSRPTQGPPASEPLFPVRGLHPLRRAVPDASPSSAENLRADPITPARASRHRRFGLLPVRSPLLGESLLLSFPAGTKMFQFPAFASRNTRDVGIAPDGLPHSEIPGSTGICPSPGLFAACHVLLRLREPRHPPCALVPFRFPSRPLPSCLAHTDAGQSPARRSFALLFVSLSRSDASQGAFASSMSLCSSKVENNGVEPLTLCVQSRCSSQLS